MKRLRKEREEKLRIQIIQHSRTLNTDEMTFVDLARRRTTEQGGKSDKHFDDEEIAENNGKPIVKNTLVKTVHLVKKLNGNYKVDKKRGSARSNGTDASDNISLYHDVT